MTNIIRKDIGDINVYVVNKETNTIDTTGLSSDSNSLIIGKEICKDQTEILLLLLMSILNKKLKNYTIETEVFKQAILELAVLNEHASNLSGRSCYLTGTPSLSSMKRNIYPYWLMYLGIPKEEFLNRMMNDNIAFEANKYPYEKELKKMNIEEFIDFCIRNKNHMIKIDK